jgi:hypothetical protein
VDKEHLVDPTRPGSERLSGRKRGADGSVAASCADVGGSEEQYHPVACGTCGTQVGVLDPGDGLYILYNVFPSTA